jgi:hypothetical protein
MTNNNQIDKSTELALSISTTRNQKSNNEGDKQRQK